MPGRPSAVKLVKIAFAPVEHISITLESFRAWQ